MNTGPLHVTLVLGEVVGAEVVRTFYSIVQRCNDVVDIVLGHSLLAFKLPQVDEVLLAGCPSCLPRFDVLPTVYP